MDGLTAKVFRTYNASITLQAQLKELTSGTSPCDITLCHALIRGPCGGRKTVEPDSVSVRFALLCSGGKHSCQDLVLQQGQPSRGHPVQPSEGSAQDF